MCRDYQSGLLGIHSVGSTKHCQTVRTCVNDCHENIRRIETHSPHELGTKQCMRKEQINNWNLYETISSQQVFSRATLLYSMDRKSIFICKNFSRNFTCFLIHIKYKLCTCSLLIWHNITYRPISWSVNERVKCEKKLREYLCIFNGTCGLSKYESWSTYELLSTARFSSFSLSSRKGWDGFQIPCCHVCTSNSLRL
jgi:hypothetical protein